MMELRLSDQAIEDIQRHRKSGNKKIVNKIEKLLLELQEHPTTGTGKPEMLKHEMSGLWSREIDKKHRLIYEIQENVVVVFVLSAYGHYSDK